MNNGLHIKATIKNEKELKANLLKAIGVDPNTKDTYETIKKDILRDLGNMIRDIIIENVEKGTVGGLENNRPALSENEESTKERKQRFIDYYGRGTNRPLREIDDSLMRKENINVIVRNGTLYMSFNDTRPGTRQTGKRRPLTPSEKYEMIVSVGRKKGKNYEQIVPTRGTPSFVGRVVFNHLRKLYKTKVKIKFHRT